MPPSLSLTITRAPGDAAASGDGAAPGDGAASRVYRYRFEKQEILVGRDPATDVHLPHSAISLVHLRLVWQEGAWFVTDADSANGTFLDGRRLTPGERSPAALGSRLTAGPFELLIGEEVARPPTEPADTARFARQMVLGILGARREEQQPCLEVVEGPERGQQLPIPADGSALIVGRGDEVDLRLSDADASRRHLELRRRRGVVVATDLDSKNGTQLNGALLQPGFPLDHDDLLVIGLTRLRFFDPAERYLRGLKAGQEEAVDPLDRDPLDPKKREEPAAGGPRHQIAAPSAASAPAPAPDWPIWLGAALAVLGAAAAILYLVL